MAKNALETQKKKHFKNTKKNMHYKHQQKNDALKTKKKHSKHLLSDPTCVCFDVLFKLQINTKNKKKGIKNTKKICIKNTKKTCNKNTKKTCIKNAQKKTSNTYSLALSAHALMSSLSYRKAGII